MLALIITLLSFTYAWSQINISIGDLNFSQPKAHHLQPELVATYDYMVNSGGESSVPKNIGALEFILQSDLSKFSSLDGHFKFHYGHLERFGNEGSIGDAQMASNIDVSTQADRMIDLWYEHQWTSSTSTLIGLHDISSEFNVTDSSLNFLNASFGTSAELSSSGHNGPSVYPYASVGIRVFHEFSSSLSYRGGAYDGDPGPHETHSALHSDISGEEGCFFIQEIAHTNKKQKKAFGVWNYTSPRKKNQNDADKDSSYGAYYVFESNLTDSLAIFTRYGWSNPNVALIHSNLVVGGTYKGLFQTRKSMDEIGLGFTHIHFSRVNMRINNISSSELTSEAYYQINISPIVTIRPDTQYIKCPSGSKELKSAWVWALRTIIQL